MTRKLVAVLACRSNGTRLYAKPLQNLDITTNWSVLDQVISNIKNLACVSAIVLAISNTAQDIAFVDYATAKGYPYVLGDERDVLRRLIDGAELVEATDVFRVTTESPFLYWEAVEDTWKAHLSGLVDASFADGVVDGCNFEIIRTRALLKSWERGEHRHRSELATLFIRENPEIFTIKKIDVPDFLMRKDLRLTVDYPEDLIVCREVYKNCFQSQAHIPSTRSIIEFLDGRSDLKSLVAEYCEDGYLTMYV